MKIRNQIFLFVVSLFILLAIYYATLPEANKWGVDVYYYKTSLEEFQGWGNATIYSEQGIGAKHMCSSEIYAYTEDSESGKKIFLKRGPTRIEIYEEKAYIFGSTDKDLLDACHVFVCLQSRIECPWTEEFDNLFGALTENATELNVVVDENVTGVGVRAYVELAGVLGDVQSELIDSNSNRIVEPLEIERGCIPLFVYIQHDNNCTRVSQIGNIRCNSTLQDSVDCSKIEHGIFFIKSERNAIDIGKNKIYLYGDDEHLYREAIIVRNILSPEYVKYILTVK